MAQYLDWFIFTKKTVVMQRLGDLARTGHIFYVAGQIPREKAGYLAGKLDDLYQAGLSRLEQSRKRKAGKASFRLLMLADAEDATGPVSWWLVRTEGEVPAPAERERWRNLLVDRLKLTGYELVRQTRAGASAPAWTWRYEKEQEQALRHALLRAIRSRRDDELRQLIHTIWRTPGFAGARAQAKRFADLIRSDWKRSRGTEVLPEIPQALGYVRRLADVGLKLSELGVRVRGHRRS
ncbi:hypothetical protein [Thauera sp. AutoDN2]|jgi:hypothetical protein|uniref:hypothetical protein n=1 Tax=Thauera sp. AutoDN2 TaxID=3416051 RepID=UPI003F4BEA1B